MRSYIDIISLFISLGVPYGCTLAAYGKFLPDLKGMKLMNKLFIPVAFLGMMIGWVMMLLGVPSGETENMLYKFSVSIGYSILHFIWINIKSHFYYIDYVKKIILISLKN